MEQPHIALPIPFRFTPRTATASPCSSLLRLLLLLLLSLLLTGDKFDSEVVGPNWSLFTSRAEIGATLFDSFATKAKRQLGLLGHDAA